MYLKSKIEKQVNRFRPENHNGCHKKKIEIAYIHLAYDNSELIKLLLKRGQLIKEAKLKYSLTGTRLAYKDIED